MESGYNGSADIMANGQMIPGLQMASKIFILFAVWNLVNPICFLYSKKKKKKGNGHELLKTVSMRISLCLSQMQEMYLLFRN